MGENRVIGNRGKIPWHLPADFAHFKAVTTGHPVIMGRKTFESIGRALPGRTNIVITRDADYKREGIVAVPSADAALDAARSAEGADEVFILGGGEVYKLFLGRADAVYLTKIMGTFDGDAFFPELDEKEWKLVDSKPQKKDEKNPFDYTFLIFSRESSSRSR